MNSAIVEGRVFHRRYQPVPHDFTYRVALPLLDLDEVQDVCALHPLWSSGMPNAVWFRRRDFYGPPEQPLADTIRDLVEGRTGSRPTGPVLMLAHLRTWGWLFNPIVVLLVLRRHGHRRPGVRGRRDQHAVARTPRLRRLRIRGRALVRQGAPRVAVPLHGPAVPAELHRSGRTRRGADREPSRRSPAPRRRDHRSTPPDHACDAREDVVALPVDDRTCVGRHLHRGRPARREGRAFPSPPRPLGRAVVLASPVDDFARGAQEYSVSLDACAGDPS